MYWTVLYVSYVRHETRHLSELLPTINMGSISNSSNSVAKAIKGLRMFDGRKPGDFRDWDINWLSFFLYPDVISQTSSTLVRPKQLLSRVSHLFLERKQHRHLHKKPRHTRRQTNTFTRSVLNNRETGILSRAQVVLKHDNSRGISGNGQRPVQELVDKYKKVTDDVINAKMDKLVSSNTKHGQDPDSYFTAKTLARFRRKIQGHTCVQEFTSDDEDVKLTTYRDPKFGIDQVQSMMHHLYLDDRLSNSGAKIDDRGVAKTAETSTCLYCGKQRHYARDCWKKDDNDNKPTGPRD